MTLFVDHVSQWVQANTRSNSSGTNPPEQAQPRSLQPYGKIKVGPGTTSGHEAEGFGMTPFPTAHQDMIFLCGSAVPNAKITPAWGLGCHAEGGHKDAGAAG